MSNQTIQNDLQMQSLTKFIQKSAKHLYGNINNTPNEIIYKYLDYDPTLHENWKRPRAVFIHDWGFFLPHLVFYLR